MSTKKLQELQKGDNAYPNIRKKRHFSEAFKKARVQELLNKEVRVSEISELYGVSLSAVYKWLYKYSPHHKKGTIQVVQMESEAEKTKKYRSQVRELEAMVGRQQMQLDYLDRLVALASEELGYDLKKNYEAQQLSGSAPTDPSTTTS